MSRVVGEQFEGGESMGINPPSILDEQTAKQNRDVGIEQSSDASGHEWQEYARGFLKGFLQQNATMHVDALWDAGLARPKSSRALGAVIQRAKKEGWIRMITTSQGTVALKSRSSNMQLKAVWHSCLFNKSESKSVC